MNRKQVNRKIKKLQKNYYVPQYELLQLINRQKSFYDKKFLCANVCLSHMGNSRAPDQKPSSSGAL